MRILLVEDDELLGEGLSAGLIKHQYTVDWVKNGLAAWAAVQSESFDLVILDLSIPKLSGEEVLKNIRSKSIKLPIIVMTASNATESIVKNFDLGADDYIIKPFNLDELCARIRAVCRRSVPNQAIDNTLSYGDITMNLSTHEVFSKGVKIELSRREFSFLQILLENAGKIVSRSKATQCIYGWGCDIDSNALEVHVHNLRKKLNLTTLKTVRGIGYILNK